MKPPKTYIQKPDYISKDEGEGYVYLVEAVGFHGILSRCVKRCKIGKSNNPYRRLNELNSEQAPCPIEGLRFIQVENNSKIEADLHHKFRRNRKHNEWFDFWIWEMPFVDMAFERRAPGTVLNRMSITSLALAGTAIVAIAFSVALSIKVMTNDPQSDIRLDQGVTDVQ